ncbi:hypothetical protein CONLIGDRAFT_635039 [Coniochaeta ligniaria NRRL 30616]|uniref:Uncharacterized protein n=1 Tax=Coniochaeta ligniaria NRRL 30616 TaxID=1408157 RepID=A0A1J7IHC0_9PEZI|nr:hypothetical protein CONLIGDRAFT_635039 [Coniochaeta ligniaria NRRL 30616]
MFWLELDNSTQHKGTVLDQRPRANIARRPPGAPARTSTVGRTVDNRLAAAGRNLGLPTYLIVRHS